MKDLFDVGKVVVGILITLFALPAIVGGGGAALLGDVRGGLAPQGSPVLLMQPAAPVQPIPAAQPAGGGGVEVIDAGQLPYAPLVDEAQRAAAQGQYGKNCPGYDVVSGQGPQACFPPGFFVWSLEQQRRWVEEQR